MLCARIGLSSLSPLGLLSYLTFDLILSVSQGNSSSSIASVTSLKGRVLIVSFSLESPGSSGEAYNEARGALFSRCTPIPQTSLCIAYHEATAAHARRNDDGSQGCLIQNQTDCLLPHTIHVYRLTKGLLTAVDTVRGWISSSTHPPTPPPNLPSKRFASNSLKWPSPLECTKGGSAPFPW